MVRTWFTCKVKYFKPIEDSDKVVKVTSSYLVNAHSFTEAEAIVTRNCEEFIIGDFYVDGLTKTNLSEVLPYDDADDWYKVKIAYIMESDETGKERQVSTFSLLQANSVMDSFEKITKVLTSSADSWVIPSIGITKIEEVFFYNEVEETLREDGFVPVEESSAVSDMPTSDSFE